MQGFVLEQIAERVAQVVNVPVEIACEKSQRPNAAGGAVGSVIGPQKK
ncbi:MAG: hypothetical protein PVI82_11985 [Desulfobacterales bacterium]|jgi:hypothetical protein